MKAPPSNRICLVPRLAGVGGMVSFQGKLIHGLAARGFEVGFDPRDPSISAVLVIGGTRDLNGLMKARRRGIPIVQRLDGMNWLHRRRRTGPRHYLRAEYGNLLLALIRRRIATRIVYQSEFSRRWWEGARGQVHIPASVVYNGIDLDTYTPLGSGEPPLQVFRLLLVEGSLGGGYEMGLETAVRLAERIVKQHGLPVELQIAGQVSPALKTSWESTSPVPLTCLGRVAHEQIPELDRSAHLLYSADLNAACPNSVVEALGCGLPVLAFDTGALPELVTPGAGRVVPYGGDPWKLAPPDIAALADAAVDVLQNQDTYRRGARRRAEEALGLDPMVSGYLEALVGTAR